VLDSTQLAFPELESYAFLFGDLHRPTYTTILFSGCFNSDLELLERVVSDEDKLAFACIFAIFELASVALIVCVHYYSFVFEQIVDHLPTV